jgi:uncharacterized RDD family membrane protein YckC
MTIVSNRSIEQVPGGFQAGTLPPAAAAARHLQTAELLRREDRLDEALIECDRAVEIAPGLAQAHTLRGNVLERLGRTQEALAAYRRAVDLDPVHLDARNHLRTLEAQLRAGPGAPPAQGKGFAIRAGAYLIDGVAFSLLYLLTTVVTYSVVGLVLALAGLDLRLYKGSACGVDYLVPGVLSVLYFAVFEWLYGATLGKLVLRMRVVTVSGEPCTLRAALIRSVLRYVDGLFFAVPAYATMKVPLQQRIGDKAAHTLVVDARDPIIRESRNGGWFVTALVLYLALGAVGCLVMIGASSIGP